MSNWSEAVDYWRSKGTEIACKRCGEDSTMLETTIHGKTHISYYCAVCAHSGSYDDRQANAALVTCQSCGKAWRMTHPKQPCAECTDAQLSLGR